MSDDFKLVVEQSTKVLGQRILAGGAIEITPPIDEDFWLLRVQVGHDQSVVLFPKFGTFGIGFAKEEDWNTNLPRSVSAQDIYAHIEHNKGNGDIPKERCVRAIQMLQQGIQELEEASGRG